MTDKLDNLFNNNEGDQKPKICCECIVCANNIKDYFLLFSKSVSVKQDFFSCLASPKINPTKKLVLSVVGLP